MFLQLAIGLLEMGAKVFSKITARLKLSSTLVVHQTLKLFRKVVYSEV